MADVPQVTIVNGVPTGGTGTVQTISTITDRLGEVQASPTADTLLDRLKALHTDLAALDAKTPALGQALAAASTPVVLTVAQVASLMAPVLAAGSALIGKVNIDPPTSGGCTPYSYQSVGTAQDATVVKAGAGQLFGSIAVTNVNAAVRHLKFYDKATAPDSSDTPKLRIVIPANTTGAGIVIPLPDAGVVFTAGITFRMTTGVADNDATGVAANEVVLNALFYK